MFYVYENSTAGEVRITDEEIDERYWSKVYEAETEKECKQYIRKMEEMTTVYAVFKDSTGYYRVTEENCYSGNWRGGKYYPSRLVEEFSTREEAEEYKNFMNS